MKKLIKYLYYSAALALLLTVSSAAYIDPSAMTYIIQIIAGVAIAAGAAFGFYWRRIKRFFTKNKDNAYVVDDDDDDDDDYGMDDYSPPASHRPPPLYRPPLVQQQHRAPLRMPPMPSPPPVRYPAMQMMS